MLKIHECLASPFPACICPTEKSRKTRCWKLMLRPKKLSGFIRWSRRLLSRSGAVEIISCRKKFGKTCLAVVARRVPSVAAYNNVK